MPNVFLVTTAAIALGGSVIPSLVSPHNVDGLAIDLDIHNGQDGNEVPEPQEESLGAFTVANTNNTDGDTNLDVNQNPVLNEVDLMQMIIRKPSRQGADDRLILTKESGSAAVWSSKTKGTPISLPKEYTYAELPVTLWVEATDTSTTIRDIEFKITYNGSVDTVKATGIWAQYIGLKNNPAEPLWADAQDPLRSTFNVFGRFGLGVTMPYSPVFPGGGFRHGIGFAFRVLPAGVAQEPPVKVDVTRQIEFKQWYFAGSTIEDEQSTTYPFIDSANDDGDIRDEDVDPPNDIIYSIDFPGPQTLSAQSQQFVARLNFKEYVRVGVNGVRPVDNGTSGSRASDKLPWHARLGLKQVDTLWALDSLRDNDIDIGHITLGDAP